MLQLSPWQAWLCQGQTLGFSSALPPAWQDLCSLPKVFLKPFHDVKNSLGYLPLSVVSFTSMQALHPSLSKWTLSPVGSNLCQALIAWLLLMGHPGLLLNTSWAHGKKIPLSMIRNHRRRGWGWKVVGNRVMWESDWARWGI